MVEVKYTGIGILATDGIGINFNLLFVVRKDPATGKVSYGIRGHKVLNLKIYFVI